MNENQLIKYFFPTPEITYLAAWPLSVLLVLAITMRTASVEVLLFTGLTAIITLSNYYNALAIYHALKKQERRRRNHEYCVIQDK